MGSHLTQRNATKLLQALPPLLLGLISYFSALAPSTPATLLPSLFFPKMSHRPPVSWLFHLLFPSPRYAQPSKSSQLIISLSSDFSFRVPFSVRHPHSVKMTLLPVLSSPCYPALFISISLS